MKQRNKIARPNAKLQIHEIRYIDDTSSYHYTKTWKGNFRHNFARNCGHNFEIAGAI